MDDKPENASDQPEPKSWREERRERREARRAALGSPSKAGPLLAGLLLVILGAVFLLQNSGYIAVTLRNWGALFILLPVIGSFDRAYRLYRAAGDQFTAQARGAALFGVVLLIVTFVVLFDLNWAIWGPAIIILLGLGLLLSAVLKN